MKPGLDKAASDLFAQIYQSMVDATTKAAIDAGKKSPPEKASAWLEKQRRNLPQISPKG